MEWFIIKDGKQEEGFDTQQLKILINNGELLNTDLVWTQGMEDWAMIKNVPEFSSPPPIPKNIESQEHVNNGQSPLPSLSSSRDAEIVYAGFWKRTAALFLDGIVLAIFSLPIYLISGLISIAGSKELSAFTHILLAVILSATYFTRMESSEKSATYGKRWIGLKTLDTDGQRLSTGNAFARWALHIFSYITLYVGFLIQPFTARKQALHDIIANTIVVESEENKPSPTFVKSMIAISAFFLALFFIGVIAAVAIPAYQDYKFKHSASNPLPDSNLGANELGKSNPFSDPNFDGSEKEKPKTLTDEEVGIGESANIPSAHMNLDEHNIVDPYDGLVINPSAPDLNIYSIEFAEDAYKNGNFKEAFQSFQYLATHGSAYAQSYLCVMYSAGQGVTLDYKEAYFWCKKSAEQGGTAGQNGLGLFYSLGLGVTQDLVRAYMWIDLAVAKGDRRAINRRDDIAKKMTKSQIAEAQKLAKQCEQRNYKNCDYAN